MGLTRGRAVNPTKAAVHDSTQDNAGSGQRKTWSTKTHAAKANKAGKGRGSSVVVKGAAGRKTGGRRTATSNSAEVRAAMRSTRSGEPPPLHPEEEDASSDVSEVNAEEVALPTASKRQGREPHRSTSQGGGELNEVYRADVDRDKTLNLSQQPHRQASARLADRMPVVDTSSDD